MKTNPEPLPPVPAILLPYCRDLWEWPERWMGMKEDLPPGRKIVEFFLPFLTYLVSSGLAKSTIRRHVGNVWLLGAEIVRKLNYDPSLRKTPAEQLVRDKVSEDGGPLIYNGTEEDQRSFDTTCRKFHRFLTLKSPESAK